MSAMTHEITSAMPKLRSSDGAEKFDDSGAVYLITGPILTSDPIENVARGVLSYAGEEDAALGGVLADVDVEAAEASDNPGTAP